MAQVSGRKVSLHIEKRIYEIFVNVIVSAGTQEDVEALLNDFLTPTERIMLPKRLCIAYLLLKRYHHRDIASYLKVSHTTINRVSTSLKSGGKGYTLLLARMEKHEQFTKILNEIEDGFVAFIASAGGPTRIWKHIHSEKVRAKHANRTPF